MSGIALRELAARLHWPTQPLLARIESGHLLLDRKDAEALIRWREQQLQRQAGRQQEQQDAK